MTQDEDKLLGLAEVAELYGVTKQVVANWRKRKQGFPEPVVTLALGPVWRKSQFAHWSPHAQPEALAGNPFVAYREQNNLTQLDVAAELGMSPRGVQDLERGKAEIRTIHKLALEMLQRRRDEQEEPVA